MASIDNGPGATDLTWNIVLLGPSRVGKTSLLTSLRVAGQQYFEGTSINVEPKDTYTAKAFNDNDNMMRGELNAHRFSPESLPGDSDEHQYGLAVNAGIEQYRLVMQFQDYPGGWLSDGRASRVKAFLNDASAVILPIDATLLMESGREHSSSLAARLALTEVEANVREWAKGRRAGGDPALLILAPVKCESYFKDNGGRSNKADALFAQVQYQYSDIVQTYLNEGPARAEVLYAPIDTIGPIELMDVQWETDDRLARMRPTYRVRIDAQGRPRKRAVKGAEPVLAYLIRDLLRTVEGALKADQEAALTEIHKLDDEGKRKRSNWWGRFVDTAFGGRDGREYAKRQQTATLTVANENLRNLAERAGTVAPHAEYTRVRPWN